MNPIQITPTTRIVHNRNNAQLQELKEKGWETVFFHAIDQSKKGNLVQIVQEAYKRAKG